jgi:hypothetical protein
MSSAFVTKIVGEASVEWDISTGSHGWNQLMKENKIVEIIINDAEHPDFSKNWWKGISDVTKSNRESLESLTVSAVRNPKYATILYAYLCIDLKHNETLTSLCLRNCGVNSQMLIKLADALNENKSLTKLDLNTNPVWGPGMKKLSEVLRLNHTIEILDLSSNQIGVTSWQAFCDSLEVNRSLTQLNLSNTKLLGNSVSVLALALRKNRSLWSIILSHNSLGLTGITQLCDSLWLTLSYIILISQTMISRMTVQRKLLISFEEARIYHL